MPHDLIVSEARPHNRLRHRISISISGSSISWHFAIVLIWHHEMSCRCNSCCGRCRSVWQPHSACDHLFCFFIFASWTASPAWPLSFFTCSNKPYLRYFACTQRKRKNVRHMSLKKEGSVKVKNTKKRSSAFFRAPKTEACNFSNFPLIFLVIKKIQHKTSHKSQILCNYI